MRSLVVLACVALLAGCVSYRASQVVAATGGVALAVGVVAASIDGDSGETDGHAVTDTEATAIVMIPVGLVLGLSGLIGIIVHRPKPGR